MSSIKQSDKILVVAPHPDDESLGCGGFMLKYAKQVDTFCFLSSGINPDGALKSKTRISEWNLAQKFIGCHNLGIVEIFGDKPLLPRLKDHLSEYLKILNTKKYDYIFMPHLSDDHPEHVYISSEIMRQIISINGFKKNCKICFYEVWKPLIAPTHFVEIDANKKLELLALYKTQWHVSNMPQKILGLNCYRGINAGFKEYAEAFTVMPVSQYLDETFPVTEIFGDKERILLQRIHPNFISSRFDLLYGKDFELFDLGSGVVPVKIEGNRASLGISLTFYSESQLKKLYEILFAKHPQLEAITIEHSLSPAGISNKNNPYYHYPYWYIDLPDNQEEFDKTLSSRVRYNTKWYPKKIREKLGEFEIKHLSQKEIDLNAVEKFFEWKKISHNFDYHLSAQEYIQKYGITDQYIMLINSKLVAVGFVCDTGENCFFEQFSTIQDRMYRKYSLGMVLYYEIILDLIKKAKKRFYLSGGYLDYKRIYNGKRLMTYSGDVFRQNLGRPKKKKHHSIWWHLIHMRF